MKAVPLPYALRDRRRDRSDLAARVLDRTRSIETALVFLAGFAIAWAVAGTVFLYLTE